MTSYEALERTRQIVAHRRRAATELDMRERLLNPFSAQDGIWQETLASLVGRLLRDLQEVA
jgi:hypothetical protein